MPIFIEMPKLSDTMTEGTLLKWLRKVGDKITVGDVLAEVETDKATMEIEAFEDGTIGEIYVQNGGKAAVGEKIAVLVGVGEVAPSKSDAAPPAAQDQIKVPEVASAPVGSPAVVNHSNERLKVSPLAKKVALDKGVDLSTITGSGPGGRIVEKDIISAENSKPKEDTKSTTPSTSASKAESKSSSATIISPTSNTRVPLSGMRKVIAERLVASKTTIPHFYLGMEVDAAPLLSLRAALNSALETAGLPKLTINDFVLKAVSAAVFRVPKVNASWDGDAIIEYSNIDISVAVAIEDGLITPVIRNAQSKTLSQISSEMKDLASRARSKKLKPEEYQGGTITVSSLGPYGIENFYAIVNPPQSVILAIGSIVRKPTVSSSGDIVVGERMTIGLSADHRVVDGAVGAAFLVEFRKYLEQPALALI